MSEILIGLLERAGHKPAKHGRRWICASCPPGKEPTLSVDGEVFHCFRCGLSGNLQSLRKELGLTQISHWTLEQRRAYAVEASRIRKEADECFEKLRVARVEAVEVFRIAFDALLRTHDEGRAALERGEPVRDEILDTACRASVETDRLAKWLDILDDPAELPNFIQAFHESKAR